MSQALADSLRGNFCGVVNNCFELAPWADFLVANDYEWWRAHPRAFEFAGRKFSANEIDGVEHVAGAKTGWNSGMLALEVAVRLGATSIDLHGFDMRGSHYFGAYANGLANTTETRRAVHLRQYREWAEQHPLITVINRTPNSALDCFPME